LLHIVLIEPEIPQNTGNIARTCAVTGSALHLVGPMGFKIDDAKLRRAGLDYWHLLTIFYYDSLEEYLTKNQAAEKRFATTHGGICYTNATYPPDCHLVFGKETKGLPRDLLEKYKENAVRIPQISEARSLNLSNAAAILCYEALRQQGFPGLMLKGDM
jgi:tRNA (cytidine/uridine-2'-O-)-methyltransferase